MNRVLVISTSRALVSLLMVAALIWSGVALTVSPRTVDAALVNSGSTSAGMINSEDDETKDEGSTTSASRKVTRSSPVSASNGIASGFPGSDGVDIYTSDVTPSSLGRVTVNIAGGLAEDAEGNANTAARRSSSSASIPFNLDASPKHARAVGDGLDFFVGDHHDLRAAAHTRCNFPG